MTLSASETNGALTELLHATAPLRPVRVAVVGLGKMGVAHTAVLSMIPDCTIVGIADHNPPLGRSVRGMGHRAPFFKDVAKLLDKVHPDALFVCTQPDTHREVAEAALAAGAAVFVEKPLAHTLADAERLAGLAAEKGLPVACGYNLAHVPVFAAARHALAQRLLGPLRQARSSMYLSHTFAPRKGWMYEPARSGGGVVANVSSHLLFLLQWMLGEPLEARATWTRLYGEVEDELHAMLRLPGGVEVGFECSWSVPGYPHSAVVIEVAGEEGKLLVANDALELELSAPRGAWPAGRTRLLEAELPQPARFDVNGESLYLQDAAFLHWTTGGAKPPNDVTAALGVQRLIEALYTSAREDGRAVSLSR